MSPLGALEASAFSEALRGTSPLFMGVKAIHLAGIATLLASEVAFVIEHPEKAKDTDAVYLAGVDGALHSYVAIHSKDTSYRLAHLDDLIQKRDQGKLPDYVHATAKKCK